MYLNYYRYNYYIARSLFRESCCFQSIKKFQISFFKKKDLVVFLADLINISCTEILEGRE